MLTYPQVIDMLKKYDDSRIEPFEQAYGYEDTRVNIFNFDQFKKYLGHIENLSKKAGIRISGISFIYGATGGYLQLESVIRAMMSQGGAKDPGRARQTGGS